MLRRTAELSRMTRCPAMTAKRSLITQAPARPTTPRPLASTFQIASEDAKKNRQFMRAAIEISRSLREKAREGGGKAVLDKWKSRGKGKLGVRERVDALIDPGSAFLELSPLAAHDVYPDPLPGAGLVTGIGRQVKKHLRAQQIALENKLPCIYLVESGGAALPYQAEVFPDHDHFGRIFYNMARMSGLSIPQISVVHGISVAGGAYMPAMSDVVIIVKNQGRIFLAGPPLVKAATGEVVDDETLGGGEMHTSVSGVADHLATSDSHAIRLAREAVLDLGNVVPKALPVPPVGRDARPPLYPASDLDAIVPADSRQTFDMREIIARIVDGSEFREFKQEYGKTVITGFAEIHGQTVGIVANNGVLLSPSALKATHFMELCSQRQIPLLFLVNVSGYMVGEKAERGGIAKDGAKMVRAVARAKVPKFTVIVGGSFGAGNYGMCGRAYSPRFLWMWPNAKISVMGPDQLSSVMQTVSSKKNQASNQEDRFKDLRTAIEEQSTAVYSTARLWDDGIIEPSESRDVIGLGLELAAEERASRINGGGHASRGEIGADGDGGDWGVFRM